MQRQVSYDRTMKHMQRVVNFAKHHRKRIVTIGGGITTILLVFVVSSYVHIGGYGRYTTADRSALKSQLDDDRPVGIVLGGGIKDGKPKPLLKGRLDTSAELLKSGLVRKLIVSGDNRFVHYNEPQVMKNYLVREKGIDPDKIQLDNAGRSTYETCERAQKIFELKKTVLISESTHLPRAVYLCRSFGVEAYGFSSDGEATNGLRIGQRWREVVARAKANINIYLIGEQTVLGDKIKV